MGRTAAAGEKKRVRCRLDKTEDVEAAVGRLPGLFPGVTVGVVYDEKKKRFLRKR